MVYLLRGLSVGAWFMNSFFVAGGVADSCVSIKVCIILAATARQIIRRDENVETTLFGSPRFQISDENGRTFVFSESYPCADKKVVGISIVAFEGNSTKSGAFTWKVCIQLREKLNMLFNSTGLDGVLRFRRQYRALIRHSKPVDEDDLFHLPNCGPKNNSS